MNIRRSKKFLLFFFLLVFMALSGVSVSAQDGDSEARFFSPERFSLNREVIDKIPSGGRTEADLRLFAVNFTNGVAALSDGRTDEARKYLLKAREAWPEYFGTDFLLGLVYEKYGDHATAARYYKTYLVKLLNFYQGKYRISAPLIVSVTSSTIESYGESERMVEERLSPLGIKIGSVRPVSASAAFLIYPLVLVLAAVLYFAVFRWVWPYYRRHRRIRNLPEGYWVCRNCDAINPVLSKVCQRCGRMPEPGAK